MKVVIFADGLGTRISEETDTRPKPMVEIGGRPVLWHIMKTYSYYGLVILLFASVIKDV
jgi:glucose-1-phosphate cytidylyltransferase